MASLSVPATSRSGMKLFAKPSTPHPLTASPKNPASSSTPVDILRLASLQNERRILVAGRPTIVFDVVPDPSAKASTIEEKLVSAMAGTVSIDESTGNLQDVNTRGMHDVKLGGGLVANVHKGFAVHILVAPQPDGVWLLTLAEGTGDAPRRPPRPLRTPLPPGDRGLQTLRRLYHPVPPKHPNPSRRLQSKAVPLINRYFKISLKSRNAQTPAFTALCRTFAPDIPSLLTIPRPRM